MPPRKRRYVQVTGGWALHDDDKPNHAKEWQSRRSERPRTERRRDTNGISVHELPGEPLDPSKVNGTGGTE